MNSILLTRKQIKQLTTIAEKLKDIESFELQETYESGIGATVRVVFELFDETSVSVDITDTSIW